LNDPSVLKTFAPAPAELPMNGVNSQSADAVCGAATDAAIAIAPAMMTLRNDICPLKSICGRPSALFAAL
jgi:hypothetical protein